MSSDYVCEDITRVIKELLDGQSEMIVSKLSNALFEDEDDIQILLFDFNGTRNEQIQLLIDFQEKEGIPKCKPDRLAPEIWNLLHQKSDIATHSFLVARIQILLSVILSCESSHLLDNNRLASALLAYGQSSMMLGSCMATAASIWGKDSVSSNARKAVFAKLAEDPKQKDKALVRECWDAWQKMPDRYKGKAAFARDMRDKFPTLESQPVIEGWCRMWERES